MPLYVHADFNKAYTSGHVFHAQQGDITVQTVKATDLVLTSGQIVAWDPHDLTDSKPLGRQVAPGRYPIELALVTDSPGEGRGDVAAARILFRKGKATQYVMATREGQSIDDLKPLKAFGHGVDSGYSCFADYVEVARRSGAIKKGDRTSLMPEGGLRGQHASVVLDPTSGANVVAFVAGYGDGGYSSWWGLNQRDDVLFLATDFGLLTENEWCELVFEQFTKRLGSWLKHPKLDELGMKIRVQDGERPGYGLIITAKGGGGCEFNLIVGQQQISSNAFGSRHRRDGTKTINMKSRWKLTEDATLKVKFLGGIRAL